MPWNGTEKIYASGTFLVDIFLVISRIKSLILRAGDSPWPSLEALAVMWIHISRT